MNQRAIGLLLVALALVFLGTAQAIYDRPMDALSVAWFISLMAASASATVSTMWMLVRPLWRRGPAASFDGIFWLAFLVLPVCVGVLATAIWTLVWYYLGWV